MAKYRVDGFLFETEEEAKQAKKEADGIRYIRSQTRMNNPDVIFKLYNRLLEQDLFETPVGLEFLRELQTYLETIPYIKKEDIAPIPVPNKVLAFEKEKKKAKQATREQVVTARRNSPDKKYRQLFYATGIGCIVLSVIIVGIFIITYLSGTSMNIFNYEQRVIDKYESWEKELKEREDDVTKRELLLQRQLEE